jgi:hypothetical protein
MQLERLMTPRNLLVMAAVLYVFMAWMLPYIKLSVHTVDRHYVGYFTERVPRVAHTTKDEKYFIRNNIPFVTIEQHHLHNEEIRALRAQGIPSEFDLRKQHYLDSAPTITNLVKHVHRRLQETPQNTTVDTP